MEYSTIASACRCRAPWQLGEARFFELFDPRARRSRADSWWRRRPPARGSVRRGCRSSRARSVPRSVFGVFGRCRRAGRWRCRAARRAVCCLRAASPSPSSSLMLTLTPQFDAGADHPLDRPFVAGVFVVRAEFVGARFGFGAGEDEAAVVGDVRFLLDRFGQRFDLRRDPFAGDLAVGVVATLDQEFAGPLQRFGDVAERRFRRGHPTGAVVDVRLVLFEAFELAAQLQRAPGPERVVGRFRDPFRRGDFALRSSPAASATLSRSWRIDREVIPWVTRIVIRGPPFRCG